MNPEKHFSFGKNWQNFLCLINDARRKDALLSIVEFMRLKNLRDKTFLDAGCGSGLFSEAAFRLGAEKIMSIDIDPFSVACCCYLHEKAGHPKNWEIREGSVLDENFLAGLGTFDIVYSWGVLHHTGKMWDAIRNTARLVKEGGLYYIAIYNKVEGGRSSEFWLKVKRFYNRSSNFGKAVLEFLYMAVFFLRRLVRFKNPIPEIIDYRATHRGMSWKIDIVDWLGGYPYEFASVEEVFQFVKKNFPNFNLLNLKTADNVGANWFLFVNIPLAFQPSELAGARHDASSWS